MNAPPELDWDDLRHFLLAAKAGTLAGAARGAGVQHTTIGRRLTALERSLGAPLFLRGPEGLSLTPMGEALLPLVLDIERAVLAVCEQAASRRTRVRLALPSGFIAFLADDLARFGRLHPELTLETRVGSQLADLKRGEADLAIRGGPINDEALVATRVGETGWSLYASPLYLANRDGPVDPRDLAGHRVIGFGGALASTPAAEWLEAHAARASTALRADEIATMLDAATAGVGVALLPCLLADAEPRLERLTPEVLIYRDLWLVYQREARLNEAVRVTATFLVKAMRKRAQQIRGDRQTT